MQVTQFVSNHMYSAIFKQIEKIGEGLKNGKEQYVLVPDRFSLNAEKLIMQKLNLVSSFDFQVLNFSRLANMVIGKTNKQVLSMLDAVMIVQFLLKKNNDKLVCFNKMPLSTSFAKVLFDTISQIKSCKITPSKLSQIVSKLKDGNLKLKMQDISLVYTLYEDYIKDNFVDSNNKIGLLCEKLSSSEIFKNADVHFCNFTDFTAQDYDVIENTIKCANSTSITILEPKEQNNKDIYLSKMKTVLNEICERLDVTPNVQICENNLSKDNNHICQELFALSVNKKEIKDTKSVQLFLADNIKEEVDFVAKMILKIIKDGNDYKDICINCSDINMYDKVITNLLERLDIPFWLDQNFKLENTEESRYLFSCFDCLKWGFLTSDVLKVAYNALSNLTFDEKEIFENFSKKFGIIGSMWLEKINLKNSDENFEQFETLKKEFISPLYNLKNNFSKCKVVADFCDTTLEFIKEQNLAEKLEELSLFFEKNGNLKQSSICRQSNDKIVKILEQLKKTLKDEEVSFDEWLDMFKAGIDASEISPLPMGVNNVFVGQMLSTVFEPCKYVFVLGAIEGKLPAFIQDVGIISDSDIMELKELNLSPTVDELNKKTVLVVQQNLTLATQSLFVTMPQNAKTECQPSRVFEGLSQMFLQNNTNLPAVNIQKLLGDNNAFGGEKERLEFLLPTIEDFLTFLSQNKNVDISSISTFLSKYNIEDMAKFIVSDKDVETQIFNAKNLFFADGYTKATQVERYFACPFLHFVEYGLKLKEKEGCRVRPVDIGNILHDLVEKFAIFEKDKDLTTKEIEDFAQKTFKNIISKKQYEHLLFGSQNKVLAKGLLGESVRVCKAIHYQNKHSKYKICFVEKNFGDNFASMPEICVYNTDRKLKLRGKIDRVDLYDKKFRVIDYKTGKEKSKLDILDLYLGSKIQLFIYLYALKNAWKDKTATGAYYFPIHNEFQDVKPKMPYQNYCMNGVTLKDFENFVAQDDLISYENNKSGIVGFSLNSTQKAQNAGVLEMKEDKNAVSENELCAMINYSSKVFSKALFEILQGYIQPKPLESACEYCLAKPFCPNFKNEKPYIREENFDVTKKVFEEILKNEPK